MTTHQLNVGTFNSTRSDYEQMARLERSLARTLSGDIVHLSFEGCNFVDPVAVVLLGLFARRLIQRGVYVRFLANTMGQAIEANLIQNGFAAAMGASEKPRLGNSISFREDLTQNEDSVIEYLKNDWLGRGWVAVSPDMADVIAGKLLEVYVNAFEHGSSTVGVLSCGQHFPRKRKLVLAVGDYGVGIPSKAEQYYQRLHVPGDEALKWAFTPGMTTLMNQGARGLGFEFLRDFVQKNNGELEVYSHDGYAKVTSAVVKFGALGIYVPATVIKVTLSCDQANYQMPSGFLEKLEW